MGDVGQPDAGVDEQVEVDVDHDLALDQQLLGLERERVERGVDRSLDHVLDRGEAVVDLASFRRPQHLDDRPVGPQVEAGQVGLTDQRLLGERAPGTEVADGRGRVRIHGRR